MTNEEAEAHGLYRAGVLSNPSPASDGYRPSWILESEGRTSRKLIYDGHGGYTLFNLRGDWEWDDSIWEDSALSLIEMSEKVYASR